MRRPFLAALVIGLASFAAVAAGPLGAASLRQQHMAIAPRLAASPFGAPLILQSEEGGRRVEGEVFAVLEHPFAQVADTLAQPAQWCGILILHLNTKGCRHLRDTQPERIEMRVGKKEPQPAEDAPLLAFHWEGAVRRPDYMSVRMHCDDGPYDTRDYAMFVEAVPLEGGRTFLHMGYAFSYGGTSSFAMRMYLLTVGRGKVGFTRQGDGYVGGVRGIAERNTMRYYLAIDAYLGSLGLAPAEAADRRMAQWFDATERYARQLHEIDRGDYLAMKRDELRRMRP